MSHKQSVFITGGASGLGFAIARRFGREGHPICIADINPEQGEEAAASLRDVCDAVFHICDVRDPAQMKTAVQAAHNHFGHLGVMINNAGTASGGPFDWLTVEDWRWIMEINFFGVLYGCQAATPLMMAQKQGHIVNVGSMAGLMNLPGMSNYNVSKAAVISLSETLAGELAPFNIGVTCVCPSFFATKLAETMRSPDKNMPGVLQGLMDTGELSAEDIADQVYQGVMEKQFLITPHQKARAHWDAKCQDLDKYLRAQMRLAKVIRSRAAPHDEPVEQDAGVAVNV